MNANVVIYARYSSNNQREESITAQLRAAHAYCDSRQYHVIKEYCDEAKTGTNDHRPAWQQLINDAKSGLFSVVIFHKIDRNARNEYDYYANKAKLQRFGVHYEYVTQNIDNTPEGQMMENMLVGMAAYYSRNLSKEALKGQRENAYKARYNGGTPPLGYDVDNNLKYIINEKEAPIVRLIFERRAAGCGYTQILNELNQNGYHTKRGISFGKNSLYDILRNKKYIGVYTFGRTSGGKMQKRNNHKDSKDMIEIPGGVPAIISQETWDKVHKRMMADKHTHSMGKYGAKVPYYLTGKIYCSKCGSHMTGGTFTSKGYRYSYYSCANNNKTMCGCKGTRIKKEWLEEATLNFIDMQLLNPNLIPLLEKEIKNRLGALSSNYKKEKISLECQYNKIKSKINHLLDLVEDGETDDLIKERLKTNKNQLTNIENRMTQFKNTNSFTPTKKQITELIKSYITQRKTPDVIRKLFETFVERITVGKEYFIIKLRFEYDWWRRGESNSCPKTLLHEFLRAHFMLKFQSKKLHKQSF